MSQLRRLAAAVLVLVALTGGYSSCHEEVPRDSGDNPLPEIEKTRIVFITVWTNPDGPFRFSVLGKDPRGIRADVRIGPATVTGKHKEQISYTAGGAFNIEVEVYGVPPHVQCICHLDDGGHTYERKANGYVTCPWVTVQ